MKSALREFAEFNLDTPAKIALARRLLADGYVLAPANLLKAAQAVALFASVDAPLAHQRNALEDLAGQLKEAAGDA